MIWITPDLYGPGHRALHIMLARFVDQLDPACAEEKSIEALQDAWVEVIELAEAQGSGESACLHPMLRINAPETAERLDRQHARLERIGGAISRQVAVLRDWEDTGGRRQAMRDLCRLAASFLAACEQHQRDERHCALPALLDAFPPPALHAAAQALAAASPSIEADAGPSPIGRPGSGCSRGSNFFAHARLSLERAARGPGRKAESKAHAARAPRTGIARL